MVKVSYHDGLVSEDENEGFEMKGRGREPNLTERPRGKSQK